jgi:squalene-hopene/tetraprenyl-beta-curcumene cyclase
MEKTCTASRSEIKKPHLSVVGTKNNQGVYAGLEDTVQLILSHQRSDGYWWYSLEANETIGTEFILLMHYLDMVDEHIQEGIKNRILDVQRDNGTWSIYNDGPPELSTTIECYWALRIAGVPADAENMIKARQYILEHGGIEKARVFTKIHLAMFGIVPWNACPCMPSWFILFPSWFPFNIYEFSSWARATIVPLLIFMTQRNTKKPPKDVMLEELFCNKPKHRKYKLSTNKGYFSWGNFFIQIDRLLKVWNKMPFHPLLKYSINKCKKWTWEHVKSTEDIYPALAYCALAFKSLGYSNDSPQIKKPFEALKMFQQVYTTDDVPALPEEIKDDGVNPPSRLREIGVNPFTEGSSGPWAQNSKSSIKIHQQCCISPVWDTPWSVMALLEAGISPDDPALLKAGCWLISKQIKEAYGDWAVKNKKGKPGGWSFEFENDYFPDVDDTIEVLGVIDRLAIPDEKKRECMQLGINWMLSMQNNDGGFGAFDKNQTQLLVNRIPFSDHNACLDPSTPDITGRMIEFLATQNGYDRKHPVIRRALDFIWKTQEESGAWFGRWGINYIYGTWNVLMGLSAIGIDPSADDRVAKALNWIEKIQRKDGGFSESPITYDTGNFSTYGVSVPSQSAWALMGLVAGGRASGSAARRCAEYLLSSRNAQGGWNERHHTGTGFQGHFYIRYHGYRHFFPLLALGRYFRAIS